MMPATFLSSPISPIGSRSYLTERSKPSTRPTQQPGLIGPDAEQEVARMVRDGKLDLGYVGAQGWDELGVKS